MQKDLEEKSPLFGLSSVFQLPCSSITHSCTKQESELESCDTSRKLHVLAPNKTEASSEGTLLPTDSPKPQGKRRMTYTKTQTQKLCEIFSHTRYPSRVIYDQLSQSLTIPTPALKTWFKNHRARCKNDVTRHTRNEMRQSKANESSAVPPIVSTPPRMLQSTNRSCCRCRQAYQPLLYRPQHCNWYHTSHYVKFSWSPNSGNFK